MARIHVCIIPTRTIIQVCRPLAIFSNVILVVSNLYNRPTYRTFHSAHRNVAATQFTSILNIILLKIFAKRVLSDNLVTVILTLLSMKSCGKESPKLMWWCYQLLSEFLEKGHLPRVSRLLRLPANDKGDN